MKGKSVVDSYKGGSMKGGCESSQKMTPMNGSTTVPKFGMNESGKKAKMHSDGGMKSGKGATSVPGKRYNCGHSTMTSKKY